MNDLLLSLLCIPTTSGQCEAMQGFLVEHADKEGLDWVADDLGNLYITKGKADTYPCIVAHMDTVHPIDNGGLVAIEINGAVTGFNPMTMEQSGIGGDDKCGIWAALQCLEELPACKAVFFVDEEIGCVGSGGCDLGFFKDCRFILQADRRGSSDWVSDISGPLGSVEFQTAVAPYLTKHGYKQCSGAMSDVMALRDSRVGISVANMSAGYYNPHDPAEYISLSALENVCAMMVGICLGLTQSFPFIYTAPKVDRRAFSLTSSRSSQLRYCSDEKEARVDDQYTLQEEEEEVASGAMFPDYDPINADCCEVCADICNTSDMTQVSAFGYVCQQCYPETRQAPERKTRKAK